MAVKFTIKHRVLGEFYEAFERVHDLPEEYYSLPAIKERLNNIGARSQFLTEGKQAQREWIDQIKNEDDMARK